MDVGKEGSVTYDWYQATLQSFSCMCSGYSANDLRCCRPYNT